MISRRYELSGTILLTTSQVSALYGPAASKGRLAYFSSNDEKKGRRPILYAMPIEDSSDGRATKGYDVENLERLSVALECERAKFSLKAVSGELEASDFEEWTLLPASRSSNLEGEVRSLLGVVALKDARTLVDEAARAGRSLFSCKRCSIFLLGLDAQIFLMDRWAGLCSTPTDAKPASTSFTEDARLPVAVLGDLSDAHLRVESEGGAARSLRSYLQVPVWDRKGVLRGVVCWQDRVHWETDQVVLFNRIDLALARTFACGIADLLDSLRYTKGLQHLSKMVFRAPMPPLVEVFKEIATVVQGVLGATRANLFWREESREQLICVWGNENSGSLKHGDPLRRDSIAGSLYDRGGHRLVLDVSEEKDYVKCFEMTKSELAIRLDSDSKSPLAVLNLESDEKAYFREDYDVPILRRFAEFAMIADRFAQNRESIYQRMPGASTKEGLEHILRSVRLGLGFEEGIVCIADRRKAVLRVAARSTKIWPYPDAEFDFEEEPGDGSPFPILVYQRGSRMTRKPEEGVPEQWRIDYGARRTLYGTPLMFGSSVVGSLVVWTGNESIEALKPETLLLALEQYATLAVTTIAVLDTDEKRRTSFAAVKEIVEEIGRKSSVREILTSILRRISAFRFERARVFEYQKTDEGEYFVCVASFGVEEENLFAFDGGREPVRLRIDGKNANPYSRLAKEDASDEDFTFKIRDPRKDGPDPQAAEVHKPRDCEWALGPLRGVDGKFWGYIAADNKVSRAPITETSLEYLALCASLVTVVLVTAKLNDHSGDPS